MSSNKFVDFYRTLHGYLPFPWQVELAERASKGRWPDALNLPTSSGKTAVVDVWLWAHSIGLPTPRRLYYVIDRRVLVDAVALYAQGLFQRSGVDGKVVRLRGGQGLSEDTWMLNPGGVALISTTLDVDVLASAQPGVRRAAIAAWLTERGAPSASWAPFAAWLELHAP